MVVSFEQIISNSAFNIMKLAYWDLKLGNVLRFFFYKKTIFLSEPQFFYARKFNNAIKQTAIFLMFFLTFFLLN